MVARFNQRRQTKESLKRISQGRYAVVAARLDQALRSRPEATDTRQILDSLYERLQKLGSDDVDAIEEIVPYRVAMLQLVLSALNDGRAEIALRWLEKMSPQTGQDQTVLQLQAFAFEFMGEYERALDLYSRLIDLDPEDPDLFRRRSAVYMSIATEKATSGSASVLYEKALSDVDRTVELSPDWCDEYVERGRILVKLDRLDDARAAYDRALLCDPALLGAYHERAAARQLTGDPFGALMDLQQAIDLAPDRVDAYVQRGDLLNQLDRYNDAREDFTHALKIDKENTWARAGRISASIYSADELGYEQFEQTLPLYEAALADCDQLLLRNSEDTFALWYRAVALRSLDGYDFAAESLSRLLELLQRSDDVSIARVHAEMGEALRLWGHALELPAKLEEAIAAFALSLDVAPNTPELSWVFGATGSILAVLGRRDEAARYFSKALHVNEDDPWVHTESGKLALDENDLSAALKSFERAIAFGVDPDAAYIGRGRTLERMGQVREAETSYEAVLRGDQSSTSFVRRGAYFDDFDTPEAVVRAEADFRRALALDDANGEAYNSLAWLFISKVRTPPKLRESLGLASRAVELARGDVERGFALDTLGWAYYRLERYEDALPLLEEAQGLAPYRLIRRAHVAKARDSVDLATTASRESRKRSRIG